MSIAFGNLVQETTNTTGAGAAITLTGAAGPRSRPFSSQFTGGTPVAYSIYDGDGVHWISVSGVYNAGTLSRTGPNDVILDGSSGPGVDITLSGSTPHTVFCDLPSQLAPAMVLISDFVVSSPQPSVTFSNIPQHFRHLCVIQDARVTDNVIRNDMDVQLNGDTGNNYDRVWQQAAGTTGGGGGVGGGSSVGVGAFPYAWTAGLTAAAGESTTSQLWVYNYSGTTFQKKMMAITNNFSSTGFADFFVQQLSGHWRNTAAVTSIKLLDSGAGNIVAGSVFSLYGIR